jgi:hypothetical protein
VATSWPNFTVAPGRKPVPETVTSVPPSSEPLAGPTPLTASVIGLVRNVAATRPFLLSATVQLPVPEQPAPCHPANLEPSEKPDCGDGVALSMTVVPEG